MSQLPAEQFIIGGVAFFMIASLTWYFSTRRELFILVFSFGRHRETEHQIPGGEPFKRGMRLIAKLQMGVAAAVLTVGLAKWLFF